MEIELHDSHKEAELLAERQFECAYAEADTNGAAIDWRYWVEQLPMLSAGQAARLMKGLDPVAFADLSARPTKADPTELCKHALLLEQLAIAQGKTTDTHHGWLAWAAQHKFKVHPAFRDEVNAKPLTAPAQEPATDPPTTDSTPAQTPTTPPRRNRKPAWHVVAMPYMRALYKSGSYRSAREFYKALVRRAGEKESPFTKERGALFCPEAGTTVSEGTIGTQWADIRRK